MKKSPAADNASALRQEQQHGLDKGLVVNREMTVNK